MKFDIGDESRFLDFFRNLKETDKIAIISHTDLDGMVAAYVTNKAVKASLVKFVNYEDLAMPLVHELKENKITKVIFTDLYLGDHAFLAALEKFAEILILDHHLAQKDWNSSRTVFIKVEDGICAGYLCYYLFSKELNLEKIDWLVACSCISDYCHVKTSDWLSKIYEKYGDTFEQVGTYVRTSGPIWDLQEALSLAIIYYKDTSLNEVFVRIKEKFGTIGDLRNAADEVRVEVKRLVTLFNKEKIAFDGGYLFEFTPRYSCGSMVSSILSSQDIHTIILTLRPDPDQDIYHVSARRQDKKINMADFLKGLVKGLAKSDAGGHVPAAGGSFGKGDLKEFKKRLGVKA